MTKKEFILKTIISMAGNKAFADEYEREDAELQTSAIIHEARRLANEVATEIGFDKEHEPNMDKVREVLRQEFSVLRND